MAYLYAEPICRYQEGSSEKVIAVDTPLNLDGEYDRLVNHLKSTNKQFTILREAVNYQSLAEVIQQNPKIIHISSHGNYDSKTQQFYLNFEDIENGLEDKFSEQRLSRLLGLSSDSQPRH